MEFLISLDIFSIFLIELETYCQYNYHPTDVVEQHNKIEEINFMSTLLQVRNTVSCFPTGGIEYSMVRNSWKLSVFNDIIVFWCFQNFFHYTTGKSWAVLRFVSLWMLKTDDKWSKSIETDSFIFSVSLWMLKTDDKWSKSIETDSFIFFLSLWMLKTDDKWSKSIETDFFLLP